MFNYIEKEYKDGIEEKRFFRFYWPKTVVIVMIALICGVFLGVNHWLVYGVTVLILVLLVIFYVARLFYRAYHSIAAIRKSRGLIAKITILENAENARRVRNLAISLSKNGIHTKHDLELTLSYFQSRLPGNSRPNFLEWFLTALITLSSIVIIAYDDSINTINIHRLVAVFGPALVVALFILTPFVLAKIITTGLSRSRNKTDTSLVEDLAYICVHFDQFQHLIDPECSEKNTD